MENTETNNTSNGGFGLEAAKQFIKKKGAQFTSESDTYDFGPDGLHIPARAVGEMNEYWWLALQEFGNPELRDGLYDAQIVRIEAEELRDGKRLYGYWDFEFEVLKPLNNGSVTVHQRYWIRKDGNGFNPQLLLMDALRPLTGNLIKDGESINLRTLEGKSCRLVISRKLCLTYEDVFGWAVKKLCVVPMVTSIVPEGSFVGVDMPFPERPEPPLPPEDRVVIFEPRVIEADYLKRNVGLNILRSEDVYAATYTSPPTFQQLLAEQPHLVDFLQRLFKEHGESTVGHEHIRDVIVAIWHAFKAKYNSIPTVTEEGIKEAVAQAIKVTETQPWVWSTLPQPLACEAVVNMLTDENVKEDEDTNGRKILVAYNTLYFHSQERFDALVRIGLATVLALEQARMHHKL